MQAVAVRAVLIVIDFRVTHRNTYLESLIDKLNTYRKPRSCVAICMI